MSLFTFYTAYQPFWNLCFTEAEETAQSGPVDNRVMANSCSTLNTQTHTDGAFCPSSVFILCIFWYTFRDIADAYPNIGTQCVAQYISCATSERNKQEHQTDMEELHPHAAMHFISLPVKVHYHDLLHRHACLLLPEIDVGTLK